MPYTGSNSVTYNKYIFASPLVLLFSQFQVELLNYKVEGFELPGIIQYRLDSNLIARNSHEISRAKRVPTHELIDKYMRDKKKILHKPIYEEFKVKLRNNHEKVINISGTV